MSLASKLKFESVGSLASVVFYGIAGIILLVMLPLSGFPLHVALTGIASLIAAFGLFMKRKWAIWLVVVLFFVVSVFTFYTLYYVVATDIFAAVAMAVYAVLTWAFTIYIATNRNILLP